MKPKIDYLGKVSCTVSKDYWSSEKDYDKLTIVEKEGVFGTFISRKPVLAGTPLTNREFWIPFSSVKESIVLDYNSFKDKYDKQLNEYKIYLDDVIARLKVLEESKTNIDELEEIANTALYKANNALTNITNINNKLAKPNGIATLDSTGKIPLIQLPDNIGGEGSNLELGETSTTAYPGDKGKKNANAINSLTDALDSLDNYSKTTRNQLDAFKNTKGQALGIAPLDENGKVTSSYLPSYVDDVLEYSTITAFPTTGESGKIYIALDTNKTYRWGGTTYAELTSSITLGETSSTAYAGDKGKKNREDINSLTSSFNTLTNHVDNINTKATNNATNIEDLTEELGNTQSGLSNHIQEFKDYKLINEGVANKVTELDGEVDTLTTTVSSLGQTVNLQGESISYNNTITTGHINNKSNPHEVTKTQIGLGNVTNDQQVKRSEMGTNNGVATLDADGKVPESQLPDSVTSSLVLGETEGTAYEGSKGAKLESYLDNLKSLPFMGYGGSDTFDSTGYSRIFTKIEYDIKSDTFKITGSSLAFKIPTVDSTKTEGCGLLLNTDKKKLDGLFDIAGGLQDIDVANPTSTGITLGLDYYTFNKTTGETGTNTRNISIPALTDNNTTLSNCGLLTGTDRTRYETAVTYIGNLPDNIVGSGHATAADNGIILSLDGTNKENGDVSSKDILIPNADATKTDGSGLMLNEDKAKLNSINTNIYFATGFNTSTENIYGGLIIPYSKSTIKGNYSSGSILIPNATTSKSGVMTSADKVKLDSLSNYTLPIAGSTTLGGVKIGSGLNIDSNGIVSVDNKLYILVDSLESVTTPDANKIYLVLNSNSTSETNSFTEYVWITTDTSSKWEKLGEASATVDLADYYTKTEVNNKLSPISESITYINSINSQQQTAINNKVDKVEGKSLSTNDFDNTYKTKIDNLPNNIIGSVNASILDSGSSTDGFKFSFSGVNTESGTVSNKDITIPISSRTSLGLIKGVYSGSSIDGYELGTKGITYRGEVCSDIDSNEVFIKYKYPRPSPTATEPGLMSYADKTIINSLDSNGSFVSEVSIDNTYNTGIKLNVKSINTDDSNLINEPIIFPLATQNSVGLMSATDKARVDSCLLTVPYATSETIGGITAKAITDPDIFIDLSDPQPTVTYNNSITPFMLEVDNYSLNQAFIPIPIPLQATTTKDGLMSSTNLKQHNTLYSIARGNTVSEITGSVNGNTYSLTVTKKGINTSNVQTTTSSSITLPLASTTSCGLLSKEDKIKLDSCITSIPEANYNVLGGIKPTTKVNGNDPNLINGTEVNVVDGVANFVCESTAEYVGANYKIIREATTEKYGLMSPDDKVKLNDITEYTEAEITTLLNQISF